MESLQFGMAENSSISIQAALCSEIADIYFFLFLLLLLHHHIDNLDRLVATLGAKSNLKKVNRKDILNVNVPKACNTIIAPDAPMALRLQSNLL